MLLSDALLLGRVSNLPTVWTNLLAGVVLAGGAPEPAAMALLLVALTALYVGGMYLNDAFDAEIDARERPERPIPAGRVRRRTVFTLGFAMLGAALVLLAFAGRAAGTGWLPVAAGFALALAIVLYDAWHKANPLSPLVMGVCRMLVYVTAAYCVVDALPSVVAVAAAVLLAYLIGLTYVAKQENLGEVKNLWPLVFLVAPLAYGAHAGLEAPLALPYVAILAAWVVVALRYVRRRGPGDIPRAVVSLIAGISLVDAVLVAAAGHAVVALIAVAGFGATLVLQRVVPGT